MAIPSKPIPYSAEELEAMFYLDTEAGQLIRRDPASGRFRSSKSTTKYRSCTINGISYLEHRLIWIMAHRASIPKGMEIDHRNLDASDNRPANLRLVTPAQNQSNKGKYRNNSTGFKGVSRSKSRFLARISVNGLQRHIGLYSTAIEAAEAYDKAALELHGGEFARTNARLGLLPAAPEITAAQQVPEPAPASVQQVPTSAPASRSYPGVPDMPLPLKRREPAWTRPASKRCTSVLAT